MIVALSEYRMPLPNQDSDEIVAQQGQTIRLQKVLAAAGFGSRRACEEYITDGRVMIDGRVVDGLGARVDPDTQEIKVDGELLRQETKRYYLLNKPAGCVCTNRDPGGRPRAIDLVPDQSRRLFTVGRLDESSQGLLLITNDGEMAHRLAHPKYRVSRTYRVQVAGKPTQEVLGQLKQGLHFSDGLFKVARVKVVRLKGRSSIVELTLNQGRNREIRRLMARIGHKVMKLERISFGPLKLGRLPVGSARPLRDVELKELRQFVEERFAEKPPGSSGKKSHSQSGRKPSKQGSKNTVKKRSEKTSDRKSPGRRSAAKKAGKTFGNQARSTRGRAQQGKTARGKKGKGRSTSQRR